MQIIVIKNLTEITTQINYECKNYYSSKIELDNLTIQKITEESKIYSFVGNNSDYLGELNIKIPKLLNSLWEEPKLVALLLCNSDNINVKEVLAPLFCNNFYQNILSPYTVEENLLYIIYLMLKDEINKLDSINHINNFLNQTPCGYILSELKHKNDIKEFAKIVIQNVLEKIEISYSDKALNLDIDNIENELSKFEEELKKKKKKKISQLENLIFLKSIDYEINVEDSNIKSTKAESYIDTYHIRNQNKHNLFNEKYICNLDRKKLKELAINHINENDMKDYASKYVLKCSNDENLFSNEILYNKIFNSKYSKIIFLLYQIDFLKSAEILDLLINSFIDNIEIIPTSLKCISKIIYVLIKRKFPNIKQFEQNAFVGKFLFINLLIPIFLEPIKIYINNFIISQNSISNLKLVLEVFSQLMLGNLYNNKDNQYSYMPYNLYFIEKMPKVFEIYKNITNVPVPKFIEKLINEEFPDNYKYEYFNENKEEIVFYRTIFISLNDIAVLMKNMDDCKNILFPNNINAGINDNNNKNYSKLYMIFQRLNSEFYQNQINQRCNKNFEVIINNKKKYLFNQELLLFDDLLINPNYQYLFNIEQKKPHFYIKELTKINNEESIKTNNIIKIKNYLCSLLYNCRKLNNFDFPTQKSTLEILNKIKIFLKSNEYIIDNTIPNEWYVNSLLDCLKKLPRDLSDNDYRLLYENLEENIKSSIKVLDFEKISDCFGKMKNIKKNINYFNQAKGAIIDINLNQKVKNIIENKYIPIEMLFKNNKGKNEFLIIKLSDKKELPTKDINPSYKACRNVEQFIKYFPNFVKLQQAKHFILFDEINNLEVTKRIYDYIDFISEKIDKKNLGSDEQKIIKEKIYDFILSKLYDKLYPINPDTTDLDILNTCKKLSWTEPKNFIEDVKDNNYDIFMDDIKQLFMKLLKEKSPRKKIIIIKEIFQTIEKVITFNDQANKSGTDDNLHILLYIFVKIQPRMIKTDIDYINLFFKDDLGLEEQQLSQLITVCNILGDFKTKYLIGVSEEEYINNCNLALKGKRI